MFVKDLKFGDGLGFFRETQVYLFPANYVLACFKLGLDNFETEVWKKHLRDFSFDDSYVLYEKFKDLPRKQIFDNFLDYVKFYGFGEARLLFSNDKKLIFNLVNDSYKNYYAKLYGHKPSVSPDEILAGFLQNYFSLVYQKKLNCKIIELQSGVNFELEITDEGFSLVSDKYYPKFEYGNVSLSLKKLLIHNGVTFEKGFFLVSGIKAFNIPHLFMLNFINVLNGGKDDILKTFNSLGYVQGNAAYSLQKFLGMPDGQKIFDAAMDLSHLGGVGMFESKNLDFTNVLEINNIDFYSNFYEEKVLEIYCLHIAYMYKSIFDFSFNKTSDIEFKSLKEFSLVNLNEGSKFSDLEEELYEYLTTRVLYTDKN